MKPVGPKTSFARILDNKSLMLLNLSHLGIRYIWQLVALTNTNITTPGGTVLPTEVWIMILELALVDLEDSFCFVQGISLQKSSMGKIFRCRRINLEGGTPCGDLDCGEAVHAFEEFMNKPNQNDSLPFTAPTLQPGQGCEDTFDILIASADDNLPVNSACLFSSVTVPDVISHMEGGGCGFCFGSRLVCPGCTGGKTQEFDVFMGCGVELTCPLCIGVDFSQEHKAFLKKYYWDSPPEEEAESMDNRVQQRMEELGY